MVARRIFILLVIVVWLSACAETYPVKEGDFFTPMTLAIPKGYSILYLYRDQEPWTSQDVTRFFLNDKQLVRMGESSYTYKIIAPGTYVIATSLWNFNRQITIEAGYVYYLDFHLNTILFPAHAPQDIQYIVQDNTRYLTGEFLFKTGPAALHDLAACRYVPAKL